ncbi:unnamed protein product [Blepharisma stoltei]|uniref:COMM domain-containing protein n=1 Tax=Blepharisma stoltei TaxID=1481888 RepID=A0AAU9JH45_9CILI|nr:unnamed protein product [Blepharisma stoltei]
MEIDFSSLRFLLKATSKNQVKTLVRLASQTPPIPRILQEIQSSMELTDNEFNSLLSAITNLTIVYLKESSVEYPADFHEKLKELLNSLLFELENELRKVSKQPNLPKLTSYDWRIDIRTASSGLEKTPRIPRASLELNIEGKKEIIELTRSRVEIMLGMLGKIKEQLDNLAEV